MALAKRNEGGWMKPNLSGVSGDYRLNRIFCAQYCTCLAEPMRSAFFMINQRNINSKGGSGHFKS